MIIKNLLTELFKSNEIIDYLLRTPEYLTDKKLSEIICRAPIDIRRKKDMLISLRRACKDKDVTKSQYKYNCDLVQCAIDNMRSDTGDIFSVQSCWRGDSYGDLSLCRDFEAALKAIETDMKNEGAGDITAANIKALLNHFMNEGYAYTTVKKIHNLLGEYFRYLTEQEHIVKNPMTGVPMIKKYAKIALLR